MAITEQHEHLTKFFGILGNIISGMVFLAPMPTFYRIVKNKSTENFRSLPYLVALFSCMLWLYYALLVKNGTMVLVTINSVGFFIESFYVIFFILYANRDAKILMVKHFMALNVATLIMIIVTVQFTLHEHSLRVKVLGWICVSFAVGVFAAPLSNVVEVVRTQSVEFMSIHLSVALTASAVVWFLYGLFLGDMHIAIPNVLGFILGVSQIILYVIYRGRAIQ